MHNDQNSSSSRLTHVDGHGAARMVDIGEKTVTARSASAQAICRMNFETARLVRANEMAKGDVLQVARLAGIGAAKRTDELIPLCHSVLLNSVSIEFKWLSDTTIQVLATANCSGKTGVEMEAMVAASLASLTIYDMCKASDREISIESVQLLSKTGGARGDFERSEGV